MSEYFGELEKAKTPDEMRRAMLGINNSQVRSILEHGRYSGLSGEDTYVILAYELLRENIMYKDQAMIEMMLNPMPNKIFIDK